jgi:hypothetical protein
MKSIYFILVSLSLVILSCKKETANTPENPETSCVCPKENIGVEMPNHVPCFGFLTMTAYTDLTRDQPLSYVSANAYFNRTGDIQISGNSIVAVDSVLLNQGSLMSVKDANGDHMYYQNDYASLPSNQEWRVFGANGIPTATFVPDLNTPVADFSRVPDKLSKSLVRSFQLNGVANITRGSASISSSDNSGVGVSVILRAGSNEVCFPEEQLKLVSQGKATLHIILENTTTMTFNDKNFACSNEIQYTKTLTLNP